MMKYQAYSDFTAQSMTLSALMSMYGNLEQNRGQRFELTPIIVFLGFSVESYLNSIGARKLPIWDDLERLPWRQKVSILHTTAGRIPDWGKDPLQFASEVFSLRDKLAHGKPERVVGPIVTNPFEAHQLYISGDLQPNCYRGITIDWVTQAKKRFRLLLVYLGQLFDLPESDHLLISSAGVLAKDEKDIQSG